MRHRHLRSRSRHERADRYSVARDAASNYTTRGSHSRQREHSTVANRERATSEGVAMALRAQDRRGPFRARRGRDLEGRRHSLFSATEVMRIRSSRRCDARTSSSLSSSAARRRRIDAVGADPSAQEGCLSCRLRVCDHPAQSTLLDHGRESLIESLIAMPASTREAGDIAALRTNVRQELPRRHAHRARIRTRASSSDSAYRGRDHALVRSRA